jgi:hypothetical protein
MTSPRRPDRAPKRDPAPQAEGEKSPLERMRDLTRRVIKVPKSEIPKAPRSRKGH